MVMRFGEEKDYRKEDQLFQILEWGNGCLFYDYKFLPKSAPDFVINQYKRFNVPMIPSVFPLSLLGPGLALTMVDYRDPYILFWEWSDVLYTDEWQTHTFDIKDFNGNIEEADPEKLEVFKWVPGQGEKVFEEWLTKPGLNALPGALTPYMFDLHEEYLQGDVIPSGTLYMNDFPDAFNLDSYLQEECRDNITGEVKQNWVKSYYDLSLWAGLLWLFGPHSRQFRIDHSEIFEVCFTHGECILYDGVVINPSYYRKYQRPPSTCYRCGIDAWCTEPTMDGDGVIRYICEGCVSKGMTRIEGCTCGTRFCKHFSCPHNVWYGQGQGAVHDIMRQHGQLGQKLTKNKEMITAQQKILING